MGGINKYPLYAANSKISWISVHFGSAANIHLEVTNEAIEKTQIHSDLWLPHKLHTARPAQTGQVIGATCSAAKANCAQLFTIHFQQWV